MNENIKPTNYSSQSDGDGESVASSGFPHDVEAGIHAYASRGEDNIAFPNMCREEENEARAVPTGALDSFLKEAEKIASKGGSLEGDLLLDGDAAKFLSGENWTDDMSFCPTGAAESISATTSVLAAVPTTLSTRHRESVPGAFRMSRTGATPPGADNDDYLFQMTDDDDDTSVGFRARDAHEVLIEATLVCDRSQATNEPAQRISHTSVVHHTAPPADRIALVEAKPLYRFCLCCDMLGNWKAICFIILVIILVAGVAAITERNRQVPQIDEIVKAEPPLTLIPSMEPSFLSTLVPTGITLGSAEEWGTLEQDLPVDTQLTTATPTVAPSTVLTTNTPTISLPLPLPSYTVIALQDPSSAQSRAYDWIYQDPKRDDYTTEKLLQRLALATFYYSLMDGNGSWEGSNSNLLSYEKNECEWLTSATADEVCSLDGKYTHLSVRLDRPDALRGTLPRELWMLTSLVSISLFTHDVVGVLPDEIREMTNLKDLELKDLSLAGGVPTGVGALQHLTSLKLQKNEFSSLPSELGEMKRLQYLYLDENDFSTFLPSELGQLDELKEFVCHSSSLTGTIASEFFSLPNLEKMYLSSNHLTGSDVFASAISPSLRLLELGDNLLSGSLEGIGHLSSAISIDLFGNNFGGSLPDELGKLLNVTTLLLDSNSFTGSIPPSLGNLTNLSVLWLHNNNFHGSVPEELCNLKRSQELDISIDCPRVSCACACTCNQSSNENGRIFSKQLP